MLGFSFFVSQVILGILYANLVEWLIHKYIFHGTRLGKSRTGKFNHHWRDHHRTCRKNNYVDEVYKGKWYTQAISREALELSFLSLLHFPLFFIAPVFSTTISAWSYVYYFIHSKSHRDPEWSKRWTPWHWDHHMGKNQDANWCVTIPIMDHILGTRVYYYGTLEYNNDMIKKARRVSK